MHPTHVEFDTILEHMLGQRLPGRPKQEPYVQSVTQNYKLGSRLQGEDGLIRHYCRCGANGVAAAYRDRGMASLVTPSGAFTVVGAHVAGSRTLVISDAGIAADRPAGYYANGKVEIWVDIPSLYHMHRMIKDSTVGNGTSITLTLYHPLIFDVPNGTGMEICRSIYAEVDQTDAIATPARKSIACVPVLITPITALYYFWGQTWGMCTLAVGAPGGVMGNVDNDRDVYFQTNEGSMLTTLNAPGIALGTSSEQRAGFLLPNSAGGGQSIIMLQLDP